MPTRKSKAVKYSRFRDWDLADFIRAARPIAREIVLAGAINRLRMDAGEDDLSGRVAELLDTEDGDDFLPDDEPMLSRGIVGLNGAFALGVAVGHLVRPEAFVRAPSSATTKKRARS